MEQKIIQYLKQIEEEKKIEILLACETGSRAWGFPSPDSDYDVRFIYRHKRDWYLRLNEKKDSIERMYDDNEIDLSGWDLKKSLQLLSKSNAALLERIQSPTVYLSNQQFMSGIRPLAENNYSRIATMYHYLGMCKNMFEAIKDQPEVKLKKLFYALRTAIACKWIMEKETMPPIELMAMMDGLQLESNIKHTIDDLIKLKLTQNEGYKHPAVVALNNYIEHTIIEAEIVAKTLPAAKGKMDELNQFFRNMLN